MPLFMPPSNRSDLLSSSTLLLSPTHQVQYRVVSGDVIISGRNVKHKFADPVPVREPVYIWIFMRSPVYVTGREFLFDK